MGGEELSGPGGRAVDLRLVDPQDVKGGASKISSQRAM